MRVCVSGVPQGNPAAVYNGGGDKKHKCGYNLLDETVIAVEVFCKSKKKGRVILREMKEERALL